MGETRVDLQHLLEDLRDAYTGALEETILTEIVANALDSGATRIRLQPEPADATLTVVDDGRGMQRRELARYHDVAASTQVARRGDWLCRRRASSSGCSSRAEVVTETRRGATHVATRWHLASRYRAPWKWIPPPGLTGPRGTAVRLSLTNPLSPLLDAGYLEEAVRRHFEPLLDPAFDDLLRPALPAAASRSKWTASVLARASDGVARARVIDPDSLGRRRIPSAIATLERRESSPFIDARPRGHRGQHVRQGHQERMGLARPHAGDAVARDAASSKRRIWRAA